MRQKQSTPVKGEYTQVGNWSKFQDDLQKAYFTPVTEDEAEALVKYYAPKADVVFYPEIRSEAVDFQGNPYVRLCCNPLTQEDIRNQVNYPRLQLGVVIHEIAHILGGLHLGHNREFTEQLDKLVLATKEGRYKEVVEHYYKLESTRKHFAKAVSKIIETKCPTCQKPADIVATIEDTKAFYHQLKCGHMLKQDKVQARGKLDEFCSINGERLYEFQKENVEQFQRANGKLLIADEMGLGKTPSSIAITHIYNLFPCLIICKSGLRYQWQKMCHYWGDTLDPELGIGNITTQIIQNSKDIPISGVHFYIVSYDLLPRLGDNFFQQAKQNGRIVPLTLKHAIIDECQMIKNSDSQRTRALATHIRNIPNVTAASGTPIKNNAREYYTILHILRPLVFRHETQYVAQFVDTYMKGPYIKYGGLRNVEKFKEVTRDFIIRHTQKEVLPQLPDITRSFQYLELGAREREYDEVVEEFTDFYYKAEKEDLEFFQNVLAYFVKMRHITGLSKVEPCFEHITDFLESTDRKIAVFAHHIDVREMLVEKLNAWLKERDMQPCLEIVGSMDAKLKEEAQQKFNYDPSYRILVASTLASGEGLNLQHSCSDCVMLERQWNPANEEQAEFRFKRIGQTSSKITATYLVALDTIDEYFTDLVERKRMVMRQTLDGGKIHWDQNEILNDLAQIIATRKKKSNANSKSK